MILLLFRLLMIPAVILIVCFIAWKFMKKEVLTNDKRVELENQLIKINNAIQLAKDAKKESELIRLRNARDKIRKTLTEGKKT